MNAKSRVLEYLGYKGISQYNFSKLTGLSNGFLKSGSNISSDNLELISSIYADLNLMWVITGRGHMILQREQIADNDRINDDNRSLLEREFSIEYNYFKEDIKFFNGLNVAELKREISIVRQDSLILWEDYYTLKLAINKLNIDDDLSVKFKMPVLWSERLKQFDERFKIEYVTIKDRKLRIVMYLIELREEREGIKQAIHATIHQFNEVAPTLI